VTLLRCTSMRRTFRLSTATTVSDTTPTRALIRFHWGAGARVSLRANAIVGAAVVFVFGSAPEALATLRAALLGLVAPGHQWSARLELAAVCAGLVSVASPRVTLGVNGWMRSLAATAAMNRRAAIVALSASQAFAMIVAVGSAIMTVAVYHAPLSIARLLTIPIIIVAVAMTLLPVEHVAARVIAALALALAIPGSWTLGALSIALLAVSDRIAGGIVASRRSSRVIARRRAVRIFRARSSLLQWVTISWSALPTASVIGAAILPSIFVAFGYFVVRHNPHLALATAFRAVRISGGLAVAAFSAALSQVMLRVRPVWAWARSLPWSSTNRVSADAVAIALPLCIIPLALVPLAPMHALAVAAMIPLCAAAGSAALRGGAARQTGAAGETFAVALVAGILTALWAPAAIPLLLLAPLFVRLGARRERRSRVTRWLELQHDAVGDPAWSGPR
jgi:hypothetical protein